MEPTTVKCFFFISNCQYAFSDSYFSSQNNLLHSLGLSLPWTARKKEMGNNSTCLMQMSVRCAIQNNHCYEDGLRWAEIPKQPHLNRTFAHFRDLEMCVGRLEEPTCLFICFFFKCLQPVVFHCVFYICIWTILSILFSWEISVFDLLQMCHLGKAKYAVRSYLMPIAKSCHPSFFTWKNSR